MGWNRASFHGSNGDFSGFIQTLESDFRTNGGVSRKKMDRLTMINTYTHTVNFSTANIDKNGDAIIFDPQPGISAAQMVDVLLGIHSDSRIWLDLRYFEKDHEPSSSPSLSF